MSLSLGEIGTLLQIHWCADESFCPPYVHVKTLLEQGLVCDAGTHSNMVYQTTEKAGVYIQAIRNLPLPERVEEWRMPE